MYQFLFALEGEMIDIKITTTRAANGQSQITTLGKVTEDQEYLVVFQYLVTGLPLWIFESLQVLMPPGNPALILHLDRCREAGASGNPREKATLSSAKSVT